MCDYSLTSKRDRRYDRNLRGFLQKEQQQQQLLPTHKTLGGNTKDIRKTTDNSTKEVLVHVQAKNSNLKKSREKSTDVDNSDKINFKKLERKKAEIMALSQLIEDAHKNL